MRHASATGAHQRRGAAHHANEGIDRDVHRGDEPVARAVHDTRMEILLRAKGDGMQADVDVTPTVADAVEDPARTGHLSRTSRGNTISASSVSAIGRTNDSALIALKGDREIGALRAKGFGTTIGDEVFIGDANDKRFLAGKGEHANLAKLSPCHAIARRWQLLLRIESEGVALRQRQAEGSAVAVVPIK